MVRNVRALVKLVNQVLLLQDLHNTRMCNPLLEPETSEEIWLHEDTKGRSVYGRYIGHFWTGKGGFWAGNVYIGSRREVGYMWWVKGAGRVCVVDA